MDKPGHIYLLIEREFIRIGEPTYKIGKTTQSLRRFKGYPHDSHVLLFIETDLVTTTETRLIRAFKEAFEHRPDYGNEYFTGDPVAMKHMIIADCFKLNIDEYTHVEPELPVAKLESKSSGILSYIFGSFWGKKTIEPAAKTLAEAVEQFISHVADGRPKWYVAGNYISGDELLREFTAATGHKVSLSVLSGRLNKRLFNTKRRKKIDGKNVMMYKMMKL